MKRRTLDLILSAGGLLIAGLLVVLGLVMTNRADFASGYVRDELGQQDFAFKKADELAPRERAYTEERTGCVVAYSGQTVATGEQAECYANEYLGGHLTWMATRLELPNVAYVDGLSYRELGAVQGELKEKIATAKERNDPKLAALEQEMKDVTTVRTKVLEGTMIRNALLTSYGFSSLGETASDVATVVYIAAAVLVLLALAGFAHAYATSPAKAFAAPERVRGDAGAGEIAVA